MRLRLSALILFASGLFMAGCGDDDDRQSGGTTAQPTIAAVAPPQLSRGQNNQDVRITGSNLSGVTGVQMGDGITVQSFNTVSASELQVRVSVSRNTSAGARSISISTPAGSVSAPSLLNVINNTAPTAKFTMNPPVAGVNSTVTFDASNSEDPDNNIAGYRWDLGGGKSAQGKKITHKFTSAGEAQVQLTVTDRDQATATVSREIEVSRNKPPVARFTVSPGQGTVSTNFSFDGSASTDPDGRIAEHRWKFGDGQSATGVRVSHEFRNPGRFPVELVVTDNQGLTSNQMREVEVDKEQGTRCGGKGGHGPGYLFTVVSADRGSRTIIGRFQGNPGCQAHYRCGDIRKGGYKGRSPGKEYWIGTICEFYDLGGGLARMRVSGGRYWPSAGESKLYTWPQEDCSAPCR